MSTKYPKKRKIITTDENLIAAQWIDADGMHIISPMNPLSPQQQKELTLIYQNNIRNSPLWEEFIKIYGPDGAEKALKQCRVQTGGNLKQHLRP